MRVLSILPFSPPGKTQGGAELQKHALHKGLIRRGVEVHVLADICQVGKLYQEHEGVSVWGVPFPVLTSHPLRPGNLKIWRAWREIRRIVTTLIPGPLHIIQVTTFREPALLGYWLASVLNIPWVVSVECSGVYGDFVFSQQNWLTRLMLPKMAGKAARVITLEDATRVEAIRAGVPESRVRIIPNGLVLRYLPPIHSGGPGKEEFNIAFIGRLANQKRVDTLLEAYGHFLQCPSSNASISLTIAGDGEDRLALENVAAQKGLSNCTFKGWIAGPEEQLELASCFVNPSQSEGLPGAVLEALAFGVPVILSDIPVHRQIATAVGMADFLFPVGDALALADRIKLFASLDVGKVGELRRRCAEYGRRFSLEARDDAYLTLYREVLSETDRLPGNNAVSRERPLNTG